MRPDVLLPQARSRRYTQGMSDTRSAIFVLHGKDAFLRSDARQKIIQRLLGDADPQTCLASFEEDASLAEVLDELKTLPFLAPHRVVVVRDADAFISAYRDAMEKYFDAPAEHGTLILEVNSWPKTTKLAKKLPAVGELIECDSPEGSKLVSWIRQTGKDKGKDVQAGAAQLLAEWIGPDLGLLSNEIEKLVCYVGDRKSITPEDVSAIVAATAGPEAFEIVNAVIAGDTRGALSALHRAMDTRGAEFGLLGQLSWHVRRSLQVVQAIRAGENRNQALRGGKVFYNQDAFQGMLRRRGERQLQQDMRRVLWADLALKSSGGTARGIMQDLVMSLCG